MLAVSLIYLLVGLGFAELYVHRSKLLGAPLATGYLLLFLCWPLMLVAVLTRKTTK